MADAIFCLLMIYLLVTAGIALRASIRGPKGPGRIAFALTLLLMAFPWLRSWFSAEGQGTFHPSNSIAQFEWLLVGLALAPIQLVCLFVILTNRKTATTG